MNMSTDQLITRVNQMFPDLFVEYNVAIDGLIIGKRYRDGSIDRIAISRYALENNRADPIDIVKHHVYAWTSSTTTLPQQIRQGAVGSSTPLPYIPTTTLPYMPSVYVDDPFEKVENVNELVMQNKLFTPSDIIRINDVKARVKQHMDTYFSLTKSRFETQKYVVAGGCFTSLLHGDEPRDYDFFLLDSQLNDEAIEYLKEDLEKNATTDYGTTYRIGDVTYLKNDKITDTIMLDKPKVQIINTKYNTREELVNHFDFKHCCVSYDFSKDKLYISRDVYDAIRNKFLIPNDPKKPPASWRYDKFFAKGWKAEIFFEEAS